MTAVPSRPFSAKVLETDGSKQRLPLSATEEAMMADDKSKVGREDRARIAQSEDYEVNDFAQKHGISPQRALEIIAEAGGNRDRADEIARQQS